MNSKKGQVLMSDIYGIVLTLVLAGIILGIGLYVLNEVMGNMGAGSQAETAVNNTITALGGFSTWFTIIVVVAAAAIIIGLVMRSFAMRQQ